MRLLPFKALRPTPELAARVASVPYDVVSREEAARLAEGNPASFLHVVRSEIDLPPSVPPHDPLVYSKARENLQTMIATGVLLQDSMEALYLYRLAVKDHAQVGVAGCVSVDDYERGLIRQHEKTREEKEDDRTRHIVAVRAHAEPVLLAYRDRPEIDELVMHGMSAAPLYDFEASDCVRHTIWRISEVEAYGGAFASIAATYVADGHHRSAAARRAARQLSAAAEHDEQPRAESRDRGRAGRGEERGAEPRWEAGDGAAWFPAVLFPSGQLRILPYNRLVKHVNQRPSLDVLEMLKRVGKVSTAADPVPPRAGTFKIYMEGRWYLLELDAAGIPSGDPVAALDVSLLHERVLRPILGIGDVRTDDRIDYVGGVRGTAELERRVDSGEMALAVSLHPVTMDQLMAVSDAGETLPPKSTWFEPKLRSGLLVHAWSERMAYTGVLDRTPAAG
jgi:uncharacterized protein (DUF1015 family)